MLLDFLSSVATLCPLAHSAFVIFEGETMRPTVLTGTIFFKVFNLGTNFFFSIFALTQPRLLFTVKGRKERRKEEVKEGTRHC